MPDNLQRAPKKVGKHTLRANAMAVLIRPIKKSMHSVISAALRLAPNKQSAKDVTKNTVTPWDMT